jgi:phosphatidylserine decarboxylase
MGMTESQLTNRRTSPEPLPDNIRSVQPGGGACYRIELAWGQLRRWYLARFRPAYVRRMAELRQGDAAGAPHAILDPRDLKYCRNLCSAHWHPGDDPFRWRERIPVARWGLAEIQLLGYPLLALAILLAVWSWYLAVVPAVLLALVVYFFRDPPRRVPAEPGILVSPADGVVAEVTRLEHDDFIDGPAVRIGIFLSIFNVHINRAPARASVVRLHYSPGLFLNALNPESAIKNENMWIGLEECEPPHRRLVVRQIAGLFARRIVCSLRPGEEVDSGHKFGMIKLGSRTELIVRADPGLEISVAVGDRVRAGSSIVARYEQSIS